MELATTVRRWNPAVLGGGDEGRSEEEAKKVRTERVVGWFGPPPCVVAGLGDWGRPPRMLPSAALLAACALRAAAATNG